MTHNVVRNIYKVTRSFKTQSRPLTLIGNAGSGRKSILTLAASIYKRAKLEHLSATEEAHSLVRELNAVVLRAVRSPVILAVEEHSLLVRDKLHWVYDLFCWQNPLPLLDMDFFERAKQAFVDADAD